jgi:hypothetical protein
LRPGLLTNVSIKKRDLPPRVSLERGALSEVGPKGLHAPSAACVRAEAAVSMIGSARSATRLIDGDRWDAVPRVCCTPARRGRDTTPHEQSYEVDGRSARPSVTSVHRNVATGPRAAFRGGRPAPSAKAVPRSTLGGGSCRSRLATRALDDEAHPTRGFWPRRGVEARARRHLCPAPAALNGLLETYWLKRWKPE